MRVRRVLEYQGTTAWIEQTLRRSIVPPIPLTLANGQICCTSIEVLSRESTDPRTFPAERPVLVYIAGPFGSDTAQEHNRNVARAAGYRGLVVALGGYPVCPHTNTVNMAGPTGKDAHAPTQQFWYEGSLELLRRCDVLLVLPRYEESRGTQTEIQAAHGWGIPVCYSYEDGDTGELEAWLKKVRT